VSHGFHNHPRGLDEYSRFKVTLRGGESIGCHNLARGMESTEQHRRFPAFMDAALYGFWRMAIHRGKARLVISNHCPPPNVSFIVNSHSIIEVAISQEQSPYRTPQARQAIMPILVRHPSRVPDPIRCAPWHHLLPPALRQRGQTPHALRLAPGCNALLEI
jgi:hypothetical protein